MIKNHYYYPANKSYYAYYIYKPHKQQEEEG